MAGRRRYVLLKTALLLLSALVLQLGLVSDVRIFGAVGDVLLLVVIAAGLVDGPDRGATVGFAAGVLYDLTLDTPFGLSALTYALVGYAVGVASAALLRPAGWWPVAFAVAASAAAVGLYTALGHLVGSPYPVDALPGIALAVAAWNAALVLPVRALVRRIGRAGPDRLQLALR
ncbi:MAG TPA: rod shape-determining protein MreD [Acidimicrobiales bacterium]